MKQINLLPSIPTEIKTALAHPFWKRFALVSVAVLVGSLSISTLLQHRVEAFERQLSQYQANLSEQQPELERFKKLVQERNTLKQNVERLQHELNADLAQPTMKRTGMAMTLNQITTRIPRDVWLKTMDCDFEKKVLLLDVSAESERSMKDFLLGELPQLYGPTSVNVTTMQRPSNVRDESEKKINQPIDFQVTIQLPDSATRAIEITAGAG